MPHLPRSLKRSVSFKSDRGGNDITGTFFGDDDNLHYIWDTAIIKEHMNRDFNSDQNQYASFLLSTITAANATAWTKCLAVAVRCSLAARVFVDNSTCLTRVFI
jgi:hypothetical protein